MHALIEWLKPLFATPNEPLRRPLEIAQFGLGVCPGCRGLRGVASPRCEACGSAVPVTEDA